MTVHDYQKMFKETLHPTVVYAGEFLESRGLRFGVEYGTSSAISKATDMIIDELEVDYGV